MPHLLVERIRLGDNIPSNFKIAYIAVHTYRYTYGISRTIHKKLVIVFASGKGDWETHSLGKFLNLNVFLGKEK